MITLTDEKYSITMRKASYDKANKIYMTDSCPGEFDYGSLGVVDFDAVTKKYCAEKKLIATAHSNDALLCSRDGSAYVFVEFKNGKLVYERKKGDTIERRINDETIAELREKIQESILIFLDIQDEKVSFARENMEYILVYNIVNDPPTENEVCIERSVDKIHGALNRTSKNEFIRFGLRRFKGYLLKDVHTYTPSQFEAYMKNHIQPTA